MVSWCPIRLSGKQLSADRELGNGRVVALSDEDVLVQRRAVQALGRTWGSDAIEPLSMALLRDPDATIRREAALRLGRITNEEALASLTMA